MYIDFNYVSLVGDSMKMMKWLIIVGLAGTLAWFILGESMKDKACPSGHCSKNGRFQCE